MASDSKICLGCHVSMSAPDFYFGAVKEALSYGADTFMFYTGAPQNSFRKATNELFIKEGRALLQSRNIDESKIIVHSPYIINIANCVNPELFQFSVDQLITELRRVKDFGLSILVLHPGSHVGGGVKNGLDQIVKGLNITFGVDHSDVKIALETMSGKGSELGTSLEQIAYIIRNVQRSERLGVCLDTCHVFDGGLLIAKDYDSLLKDFDRIIGLDRLLCIHINDSKNVSGSHKDRHENIGYGEIGFEALSMIVHNDKLAGIPMILETPYVEDKPPYFYEIKMLRENRFINNWREQIVNKPHSSGFSIL